MAGVRKISRSNSRKVTKGSRANKQKKNIRTQPRNQDRTTDGRKIPTHKEIDLCKVKATESNYGKIIKGLRLQIGLKVPSLSYQLKDKGLDNTKIVKLENEKRWIDFLYSNGYEVEPLYAALVSRIQELILTGLPF